MSDISVFVKPILEEMGLFTGNEVSVKETFEKYLKIHPHGIGPLGVFKEIMKHELSLTVKELRENDIVTDYLFIYKSKNDLLHYDPRH
jgi:hypothetical protein